MKLIAAKELRQLCTRAEAMGLRIEPASEVAERLAALCGKQGGARQLRHLVQEKIESPMASLLLNLSRKPERICVTVEEGEISLLCEN